MQSYAPAVESDDVEADLRAGRHDLGVIGSERGVASRACARRRSVAPSRTLGESRDLTSTITSVGPSRQTASISPPGNAHVAGQDAVTAFG